MRQKFINKRDGTSCSTYSFNPIEIKSDEHPGNWIAIEKVFGKDFLENRTSSCSYHFDKSVARHEVYIKKKDIQIYMKLTSNLKNCVTVEEYQRTKEQYESLINRQLEGDRKPLISTFKFWDNLKYRWATVYKSNLHAIPNASLAEAAQASMKASNEKNISLVDSIYADISDSARLDAKWKNRLLGEHCRGRGPSSLELEDRYELRQIDHANRYVEKTYLVDDLMDDNSDLPPVIST